MILIVLTISEPSLNSVNVPAQIKQAILLIIGHLYENRESVSVERMYEIPMGAQTLLGSYVIEQSV